MKSKIKTGLVFTPSGRRGAEFANEDICSGPFPTGGYDRHVGEIFFANDALFLESYFSEPLTNYAVGWRDPSPLQATLDLIAPPVTVGRRFEWKKAANAEEFLSEVVDDQRAINSDFKKIIYTASDVTDKTINKGLTLIVDLDNVADTANVGWQNQKVAKIIRRLLRNEVRRGFTLLSASSTNSNVTWDTTAGKNPDQDLNNDLLTATTATGIRPNRVVYGDTAWHKRQLSYEGQTGSTAYGQIAALNQEQLASRLLVDKVYVSKERYQTGAAAKSEVVGSAVYAFFAEDGVDTEDPSNIKRFVSTFSPEQGGGLMRVFVQQLSAKLVAITVEQYSKLVATYTGGMRKWTVG